MLKAAGFLTIRLCRNSVGELSLDELKLRAGEWCEVPPGPRLSALYHAASGADGGALPAFDSDSGRWVHVTELKAHREAVALSSGLCVSP